MVRIDFGLDFEEPDELVGEEHALGSEVDEERLDELTLPAT
jgi:hypothetical protein